MNSRHILLPAVLCAAAALSVMGCGQNPAGRLIGKWEGAGQSDEAGSDAAADALGAAMGKYEMTAEFRADGTGSVAIAIGGLPDPNPWSGSWGIVKAEAEQASIEIAPALDGGTETTRAEIEFLSDGHIFFRIPADADMPRFQLSRVAEP